MVKIREAHQVVVLLFPDPAERFRKQRRYCLRVRSKITKTAGKERANATFFCHVVKVS